MTQGEMEAYERGRQDALAECGIPPVHWLENVDGDPARVRTACGRFEWRRNADRLLDPNRKVLYLITCRECLRAWAATQPPCKGVKFARVADAATETPPAEALAGAGRRPGGHGE
jgi:hypothetical protein